MQHDVAPGQIEQQELLIEVWAFQFARSVLASMRIYISMCIHIAQPLITMANI